MKQSNAICNVVIYQVNHIEQILLNHLRTSLFGGEGPMLSRRARNGRQIKMATKVCAGMVNRH